MNKHAAIGQKLLAEAGIQVDGMNPGDIAIHDERTFQRVLSEGDLGFGESYMDGWWDSTDLEETFYKIFRARLDKKVKGNLQYLLWIASHRIFNFSSKARAYKVGKVHYDVGNDLYGLMLDKRMVYTCGYWKEAKNLDDAQEAKLDLVCRKLGLRKGQRILDIGCGWGSFVKFAAEHYEVEAVGITVSEEQAKLASELCRGLPITIRLQDYRDVDEKFDHIVSLGMFEHVGYKNYRTYMEIVDKSLEDDGLFLLDCGGSNLTEYASGAWTHKYIFPNSHLPSIAQIGKAIEHIFVMEDWHNMSTDYHRTIMAWFHNFDKNWPELRDKYGDRFYRMWKFYLLACAASDRARVNHNWQVVLSKGRLGGYRPVR